jgi:hypothetical protein
MAQSEQFSRIGPFADTAFLQRLDIGQGSRGDGGNAPNLCLTGLFSGPP